MVSFWSEFFWSALYITGSAIVITVGLPIILSGIMLAIIMVYGIFSESTTLSESKKEK